MFKPYLPLDGVALLFAGTVQAEAPEAQPERARTTIDNNEATEERHARQTFLNGGN